MRKFGNRTGTEDVLRSDRASPHLHSHSCHPHRYHTNTSKNIIPRLCTQFGYRMVKDPHTKGYIFELMLILTLKNMESFEYRVL